MPYVPLSRFLLRAPLLPVSALTDRRRSLLRHPLGPVALALASPDLVDAVARGAQPQVTLALDRYRRRAAFRPTPHGLLAGVAVGHLGARSLVDTGLPVATARVAWWRLAALARTMLDTPGLRVHTRLKRAPSVIVGATSVLWLGAGTKDDLVEERHADLDEVVAAVLAATRSWTPWASVRSQIAGAETGAPIAKGAPDESGHRLNGEGDGDADAGEGEWADLDDLLVTMIDDGLLAVDLVPPLLGPAPDTWMLDRLARIPAARPVADKLAAAMGAARAGDLSTANAALASLPGPERQTRAAAGSRTPAGLDATLVFRPPRPPTLARAAVKRAADLAPLLFRLQEALVPPMRERTPGRAFAQALDAATEVFGAGALDLGALALGDYGVNPTVGELESGSEDDDRPEVENAQNPGLLALLVDRVIDSVRRRSPEVAFLSQDLEPHLLDVATPATCELFLTPRRTRAGERPGTGWLIGLHAPAGASWGRFAFALGDDAAAALLDPLRETEIQARPGERRMDVVFAPSAALADLCAHPPLRASALAVTGWPADDESALTPADLELCADPSAPRPLGLRSLGREPVAPSALHRVRSTTAPAGVWRLLIGWSLCRQHAPWALNLGPLGEMAWIPRISIDGFVVSPASWRIPPALAAANATTGAVRSWRKAARLPRFVQVGNEDELLPVDLTSPEAAADLMGRARVFEIWPPLGDSPDRAGRRLEAVVALVDNPDTESRARIEAAMAATASAGRVPPRRDQARAPGGERWQTFKLFGAADRQDALLFDVVAPAVGEAREAGEIMGWFFLRYIDGPGRRPHLRLRARVASNDGGFARRLDGHLEPAFARGDLVSLERAPYFPEAARFGGSDVLPAVHALFEADSDLTLALIAAASDADAEVDETAPSTTRLALLVSAFDALATGLGFDPGERRQLAARRRDAHAGDLSPEMTRAFSAEFRVLGPLLRRVVSGHHPPSVISAFRDFRARARAAAEKLDGRTRDRLLPPLLHLCAVRLVGLERAIEIRAYTLWERTLASLEHHRPV